MWNRPGPPGLIGFNPNKPCRVYQRNMPHWRQEGVTYFVTFRTADSIPEARQREIAELRTAWERLNPGTRTSNQWLELQRKLFVQLENLLDLGSGECLLQKKFAADSLEKTLRHDDGRLYELGAFVLMPNHVHLLVRPYSDADDPLESLVQAWKTHSAREIQSTLGRQGNFWQPESYDRIVRDDEHLHRCLQYIGNNPRRAKLAEHEARRWVSPRWIAAGWDFDS